MSDAIITESGACYTVMDKGEMMADKIDTEPDDATVPVVTDTAAGDGDDAAHVDIPSILISADVVMDVKKKWVCNIANILLLVTLNSINLYSTNTIEHIRMEDVIKCQHLKDTPAQIDLYFFLVQ